MLSRAGLASRREAEDWIRAGRITECGIDRDFRKGQKPSDHAPLIAYLDGDVGDRGRQV